MSYFLTDKQEYELNLFLDEQNKKVYEEQMKSDEIPSELKDLVRVTEDSGSPLPVFDPSYGYYSVSFTPCKDGNRIYVHHHISNVSKAIYDPAITVKIENDDAPIINESEEDLNIESTYLYEDEEVSIEQTPAEILESMDIDGVNFSDINLEEKFGTPPPDVLTNLEITQS